MCAGAGDFLGSRFKGEWEDGGGNGRGGLGRWCRRVKREAEAGRGRERPRGGGGGLGKGKGEGILLPSRGGGLVDGDGGGELTGSLMNLSMKATTAPVMTLSKSSSAPGRFSQAAQVWDAAVELLTAMVMYVKMDDDMFDEILELVGDVILVPGHEELRSALEAVNADAVWLAVYERRGLGGELMSAVPCGVPGFGPGEFVRLGVVC